MEGTELEFLVEPIILMILGFGASMIMISAPSISLEDKHLWIVQSLPVRPCQALFAKVCAHVIIATPSSVICSVIMSVMFKVSVIGSIGIVLALCAMNVFFAYFGLLLGLLFPKFDWQNENVAVKQGFAIFGAMFGGMIWTFIMAGVVIALSLISFILGALAVLVLNAGVSVAIHMYFLHGGEKKFRLLKQ